MQLDYTFERQIELEKQAAREEGHASGKEEMIRKMILKQKYSCEEIAELSDVPIERVKEIEKAMF